MKHGKKYGMVALVLANGLLCAWLARSPDVAPVSSTAALPIAPTLRNGRLPEPVVAAESAKPAPIRLNIAAEEPAEVNRQEASDFALPVIDRPPTIVAEAAVPHLPNEFQPHFEPPAYPAPKDKNKDKDETETEDETEKPVPTLGSAEDGPLAGEDQAGENSSPLAEPQPADAGIDDENGRPNEAVAADMPSLPLRHRIRDGDTLDSIAARYYGDPTLRLQIFRANPNTLVNPDLLPIDAEITVPAMDQFDEQARDDDQAKTDLAPIPATAPPSPNP